MTVMETPALRDPAEVEVHVRPTDLYRRDELRARLDRALRLHPERLVVDVGRCPVGDDTLVRTLLETHRQLRRAGARLVLRGAASGLRQVLAATDRDGVLDLEGGHDVSGSARRPVAAGRR